MRLSITAIFSTFMIFGAGRAVTMAQVPPGGSTILPVPGVPNTFVGTYLQNGWHLRVSVGIQRNAKTLWSRPLPSRPDTLKTPGPAGVFSALILDPSGVTLYAYRLVRGHVVSAVAAHPGGQVRAAEGIKFTGHNFVTLTPDRAHVGSVHYRIVVHYAWSGSNYRIARTTVEPDYPPGKFPVPNALFHTLHGDTILLKLEIADTEQKREIGLMNRGTLDSDSGMIFTWPQPVHESFWMENTFIPLSIAFLGSRQDIQEIQDMAPMTTTPHTPLLPYSYAIEVNAGFYAEHEIVVGDRASLHLQINLKAIVRALRKP